MIMTRELTEQEREILTMYARGRSSYVIAADLGLADRTVMNIARKVEAALGAQSRTHALALAIRKDIITLDDIFSPRTE